MTARHLPISALAVVTATLLASPAFAQSAPATVAIDAAACMALRDDAARLACFDAQSRAAGVDGQAAAPAAAPAAPASSLPVLPMPRATTAAPAAAAPVVQAAPASDDSFGRAQPEAVKQEELRDRISALKEVTPNQLLITLANGQVWRQVRPERYPVRVGHDVRIYPSRWGSDYRLSSQELRGFIQVVRVQ